MNSAGAAIDVGSPGARIAVGRRFFAVPISDSRVEPAAATVHAAVRGAQQGDTAQLPQLRPFHNYQSRAPAKRALTPSRPAMSVCNPDGSHLGIIAGPNAGAFDAC